MQFNDKHTFDKPAAAVMKMFSTGLLRAQVQDLGYRDIGILEHSSDGKKVRIKARFTAKSDGRHSDFRQEIPRRFQRHTQTDALGHREKTGRLEAGIKACR